MRNMPPENSFPQICVVSVNHCVENRHLPQQYGRSRDFSNTRKYQESNTKTAKSQQTAHSFRIAGGGTYSKIFSSGKNRPLPGPGQP